MYFRFVQEISSCLRNRGIAFENEKLINNLYAVDIFVPLAPNYDVISSLLEGLVIDGFNSQIQGIVIEINGPSHYESFAMVSYPLLSFNVGVTRFQL